jgi:hypothetical protein
LQRVLHPETNISKLIFILDLNKSRLALVNNFKSYNVSASQDYLC